MSNRQIRNDTFGHPLRAFLGRGDDTVGNPHRAQIDPLIEIRQTALCRAIRGNGMSVNSTLPPLSKGDLLWLVASGKGEGQISLRHVGRRNLQRQCGKAELWLSSFLMVLQLSFPRAPSAARRFRRNVFTTCATRRATRFKESEVSMLMTL